MRQKNLQRRGLYGHGQVKKSLKKNEKIEADSILW